MDGNRQKNTYRVPIPEHPTEKLTYYEWAPVPGSPDREGHVVFLFAGFLAQQVMMFPMMREFTAQGYHVVTGDFRGHGESGGEFTMDWNVLRTDFLTIYDDVKARHTNDGWKFDKIAVCGHSMGGFAAIDFGYYFDFVWTVVALAPAPYREHVNTTNPKNLAIILGNGDQAFTANVTLSLFHQAVPGGTYGVLYGDPLQGTAKKMVVVPWARHENELTDDFCLSQTVQFVEMGFGYMAPGDTYIADQSMRMAIMEAGVFIGIIGVCLLFFYLNQLELKKPENPRLAKLFDQIIGKIQPEPIFYDDYLPKRPVKARAVSDFLIDWFTGYGQSIFLGGILFLLAALVIKDIFSIIQIFVVGVPAVCSIWVAWRNYRRENTEEIRYKRFRDYLEPIRYEVYREFTGKAIIIGILMYGISLFLLLYGFGQSYMFLFPMNKRIYNMIILVPFMFTMYLLQSWGFIYHLVERLRGQPGGLLKAITITLITKHFGFLIISLVLLLIGNQFFTIALLLTGIDILITVILIINWWYNRNFGSIVLWGALLVSTIYLGYAGVINPYEIVLSQYNAFYWLG
jgi:pimeloyl-ACP methyl ester carboxylesterase